MNQSKKMTAAYYKYWGKAKKDPGNEGPDYHLLVYHSLDVAAVGWILLKQNPILLNSFTQLCGIEKEQLKSILIFFLALHDLGKFSESFQNIKPELLKELHGIEHSQKQPYTKRVFGHDSSGFLIWKEVVFDLLIKETGVCEREDWRDILNWFMEASNGHHGFPPKQSNQRLEDYFNNHDINAVNEFVIDCLGLFQIEDFFNSINIETSYDTLYDNLSKASWVLTGFFVLCDWIGSGKTFKYLNDNNMSLLEYWQSIAIKKAEEALRVAGILPCLANRELDPLKQLLVLPSDTELTPMQELVKTVNMSHTPQLFILEDETGAGKTEASLILLNRLMATGMAHGFYLALPTMATADGIFPRIQKTFEKLFKAGQKPSLVLSHSSAYLTEKFTETILYSDTHRSPQPYSDDAQSRCVEWLVDNRKKSVLAHVGVGTIDQLFLAVLKVKYQSLRLIGLLGKVLVVDEAHAYDAYMGKELEVLLEVHAAMGGSAIIMSATLPLNIREKLINAYLRGQGGQTCQLSDYLSYPLLTHATVDNQQEIHCEFNPRKKQKNIQYQFMHNEQHIYDLIEKSLKKNQCVCWIRNSVRDARESYQVLSQQYEKVGLFHARFVLADRLAIQARVQDSFNQKSTKQKRQGRLLIATQVVEQSLDLDFDIMITDLAPIDLMLQRAGRLHRHIRDQQGNTKTHGEDERLPAMLTIYAPEITDSPDLDWFSAKFPYAKKIYSNHARLWAGLMELNKKKSEERIIPKNIKPLIEKVYSDECCIPKGLESTDTNAEGAASAERSHAGFNTIDYEKGYTLDGQVWAEDLDMPTRLGEDTITLTLAKWLSGRLQYFGDESRHAWRKTEVRVLRKHVNRLPDLSEEQQSAVDDIKAQLPAQGKWTNILPMTWNSEKELWQGEVIHSNEQQTLLFYHQQLGLMYPHEIEQAQDGEQLERDSFI